MQDWLIVVSPVSAYVPAHFQEFYDFYYYYFLFFTSINA